MKITIKALTEKGKQALVIHHADTKKEPREVRAVFTRDWSESFTENQTVFKARWATMMMLKGARAVDKSQIDRLIIDMTNEMHSSMTKNGAVKNIDYTLEVQE